MGFGSTYVAHIPPIVVWYSRDSLCYGVGARMAYITNFFFAILQLYNPQAPTPRNRTFCFTTLQVVGRKLLMTKLP